MPMKRKCVLNTNSLSFVSAMVVFLSRFSTEDLYEFWSDFHKYTWYLEQFFCLYYPAAIYKMVFGKWFFWDFLLRTYRANCQYLSFFTKSWNLKFKWFKTSLYNQSKTRFLFFFGGACYARIFFPFLYFIGKFILFFFLSYFTFPSHFSLQLIFEGKKMGKTRAEQRIILCWRGSGGLENSVQVLVWSTRR